MHTIPTVKIIGGIGAALLVGAVAMDGINSGDMRTIGAVLVLSALGTMALRKLARPTAAAYELGRSDGYREGYADGRKIGRPVVVQLPVACRKDAATRGCGAATGRRKPVGVGPGMSMPVESAKWGLTGADSPS